ncbi:MAG: T9SS type A sorting domain-containing protein [Ferruginibacter sp.]
MKKIFTILFILFSYISFSQSTTLVISQAYGGGGNTGAPLNADFVELHNISGTSQSTAGLSIQYASATNAGTWTGVYALPTASIPAGGYYLIRMSTVGATGSALPTPDATTPTGMEIAMSGTNGKVALVNGIIALPGCPNAGIVDLVGYGTANCNETVATAALSNTTGALRNNNGCTETNNNSTDFTVGAPAPRNSATAPFACGAVSPSLTVTGVINDFGSVFIGSTSASQSYNLSGADLTGTPGVITITAPSTDFQVSNDNTIWGASTTIPYTTSTLAATPVWVRFSPQSAGPKAGDVSNMGGGVTTSVNVAVTGNGLVPISPVLSAGSLTAFGNVCLNTTVGPNSFTINGVNLTTADISVGPLTGFTFSTTAGGSYTPSLILTQPGGTYSQDIFVDFTPIANISYNGDIVVAGGGATSINITASGAGADNPPTVTTGVASAITTVSATLAGNMSATGCSAVSAYGFEYSLINGFVNGTVAPSSNLSAGDFTADLSGLLPTTTYYYKSFATNSGGTSYGAQQSFTTTSPSIAASTLTAFGSVCVNTTTDANSFTITSPGLTAANVMVGPLAGYTFSTTAAGPYSASLDLVQPGGAYSQEIFVKFTPVSNVSYNGNIPVTGGGATSLNVFASGSANNNPPTVITGTATSVPFNIITLTGSLTGTGCSGITSYGIEYSGVSGFANGHGFRIPASDLTGSDFSITSNSFVQHSTYYFKAYAMNGGGTAYGDEQSFTTDSILNNNSGLVIYASPVSRNGEVHFSLDGIKAGHYQVQIYNMAGQIVYQKDIITSVNFINDRFMLPVQIRTGAYYLQVSNHEYQVNKRFIVR